MISSEKSHQTLSDYKFLCKKKFKVNKNQIFLIKKMISSVIVFMSMLTRFSERIFKPMRYTVCAIFIIHCNTRDTLLSIHTYVAIHSFLHLCMIRLRIELSCHQHNWHIWRDNVSTSAQLRNTSTTGISDVIM